MSTKTKTTYDDEFKKQAVQLLINSGWPPLGQGDPPARDLSEFMRT